VLIDELTEEAYNAYGATLRWQTSTGVHLPYWSELGETHKAAWRQATESVALGYAKACNVHSTLPFWQLREPNPKGEGNGETGGRVPRPRGDSVGPAWTAERR
jgi:hypothetical protein